MAKSNRICVIDGCSKRVFGRDWCRVHYGRWRDHGNPLAGRTPNGKAAEFFQTAVLPFQGEECLVWPYARNTKGYGMMNSGDRQHIVARLVCTAVHGEPPTPSHEAAHSCGKGQSGCVNPKHIRWATTQENAEDRIRHGTSGRGEDCSAAKLTVTDVRQIINFKGTRSQKQLAKQFGVCQQTISDIHRRKIWGWLD